eukprot:3869267-Rhodomonas_salina.1
MLLSAYACLVLSAYAQGMRFPVLSYGMVRARYAVPGSDLASGAVGLRARYAVSGTELQRVQLLQGIDMATPVLPPRALQVGSYAYDGTETGRPYCMRVWCYVRNWYCATAASTECMYGAAAASTECMYGATRTRSKTPTPSWQRS